VTHAVSVEPTGVPGMFVITSPVHVDERGSFTEGFRRSQLAALGVPLLEVVQHNIAISEAVGVTRGVHAEPWNKLVTVVTGRAFQAVVDLRAGEGFGVVATVELTPGRSVFIPQGCGNAYQALEPSTAYSYLVSGEWSPATSYLAVDPYDSDLAIDWPIPVSAAILSAKDRANPPLRDVTPIAAEGR
jgi:dTDP-4-dehydrorhamnose 3,5-epimerase/reductase